VKDVYTMVRDMVFLLGIKLVIELKVNVRSVALKVNPNSLMYSI
tara:strand:+ start:372 stop:503 length:132 start_codon:yes stop_codon:yes gene_type:complete